MKPLDNLDPLDRMIADGNGKFYHEIAKKQQENEINQQLLMLPTDDQGNAECLIMMFPDKYKHSGALGWLVNRGRYWHAGEDAEKELADDIHKMLRRRRVLAAERDATNIRFIREVAVTKARISGCMFSVSYLCPAPLSKFNNTPDHINCQNGIVDLRTGQVVENLGDTNFTYAVNSEFDPHADYSFFDRWIREAVGSEMADWLQVALGYGLTGRKREEIMIYLRGPTRSGKTLLTGLILWLLTDMLSVEVPFDTFTTKRAQDPQGFTLAPLYGKRVVIASESDQSHELNSANVKNWTGGSPIPACFKHKNPFTFTPEFLPILSSNEMVRANPDDDALWGRLRIVPFLHSYLGREDKSLKMRMREDAHIRGFFRWLVDGAVRWYALGNSGLQETPAAIAEKVTQRNAQDSVGEFLRERCMVDENAVGVVYATLYQEYEQWCKDNGATPKRMRSFSQSLNYKDGISIPEDPVYDPVTKRTRRVVNGIKLLYT